MYSRQFWRLTLSRKPNLIDQPVAFFDLDLTILKVNSATLWVKSEYRQGMISTLQLIKLHLYMVRYEVAAYMYLHDHDLYLSEMRLIFVGTLIYIA